MTIHTENSTSTSLSRFKISDEHLINNSAVKESIAKAYSEGRCFEFYPNRSIIEGIRKGDPVEMFREEFFEMAGAILDSYTDKSGSFREKLTSDTHLFSRVLTALAIFHSSAAESSNRLIESRRITLIKELPGHPTIHHISGETTVIAHVGQGPAWEEVATIYLGLKTFDTLSTKRADKELHKAFKFLLEVEERAIETGFSHTTVYPPESFSLLNYLVDSVIDYSMRMEEEYRSKPGIITIEKFSSERRREIIKKLNSRVPGDELNFDYDENMKALNELEDFARQYKRVNDSDSLREVVRILVAASGHDIHEVRNRANILLERIFSPKEFDAPLAAKFINIKSGDKYNFEFNLPEAQEQGIYFLRIYRNNISKLFYSEKDLIYDEIELKKRKPGIYTAEYLFNSYGHYDFTVVIHNNGTPGWLPFKETSGRVNVLPDIRGEIILEVFVDIHGHTRTYWRNNDGHPGLVYNEFGQVIRLGNFPDIEAHLEDIKSRYQVTAIYLLGVQERGSNRENWAPEATSPSPFSPMSLTKIEPGLGGAEALKSLIKKAHTLDIKIIVDIIPHLNRKSRDLPSEYAVLTYDQAGRLVERSSTDGRYGSWDDGKLFNYRMFEVWEWLSDSITKLIEEFNIDGIRFDSAHAVPIMMKRNNYLYTYGKPRTDEEMLKGNIIVNDREYGHFITTGYYDCACRDTIAVPIHYYLMLNIEKTLKKLGRDFFINIAECFWGHEKYLTRTGLIPYNSSLFKICENITHGQTDVREIYHIYDNYFPAVLPEGTELLGILGNHDERRALNTFGHRGLRAAVALTSFMSSIIMDFEGSAEGEGWKVYLDNIYVNWNDFENASHRSLESFYRDLYRFHRSNKGDSFLIWSNNNMVAAAVKFTGDNLWIGAFNFSDSNQGISLQFDNPRLPISDEDSFILSDPLYSEITGNYSRYTGKELKISKINTIVPSTERIKILKLTKTSVKKKYIDFFTDSFLRLKEFSKVDNIFSNFAFTELAANSRSYSALKKFITANISGNSRISSEEAELGLKRSLYHMYRTELLDKKKILTYRDRMLGEDTFLSTLSKKITEHYRSGPLVFLSAEAEPFSKSGGLANVVYELPRELAKLGEKVFVITPKYRNGNFKEKQKMEEAIENYGAEYTGINVKIKIMDADYEIGVHKAEVEGVTYYLLDHADFFNGLYWGITAEEKLRKRIAFARAAAEVILTFSINPKYTFTNDAFPGVFNGIVRCDPYYDSTPVFRNCTFIHIIHNGGWQYFDAYARIENGFDLFNLFNLPSWQAGNFTDPVEGDKLNCMAAGIRFARKSITVSPSYAKQIEIACDNLEHILYNVSGISNAIGSDFREKIEKRMEKSGFAASMYPELIDYIKHNPGLKEKISSRYPEILTGDKGINSIKETTRKSIIIRMRNKLMLQLERHLNVDPDAILVTMIHRISEQKGFQLLLEASEGIFKNLGYQAIIGGGISAGDSRGEAIANGLHLLSNYYPGQVNVSFGFQDISTPLLCSDYFLMPSMHEPGGISQIEAMAAGCPVIARATGGLRDTIKPVMHNGDYIEGNGFLFSDFSPWAFYDAMERAASFFRKTNDETFYRVRIAAENSAYFWDKPAREYIKLIYDLTETIRITE